MNTLVVYFSKFGNTHKIAQVISEVFNGVGPVNIIEMNQLSSAGLQRADLVVMGSPTHKMNLPEGVGPALKSLPRRILPKMPFAAFDTSYKMSNWLAHFTAVRKLDRLLRRLGGKRHLPPETFHVMERDGPLYKGEIERAGQWKYSILSSI